MYEHIKLNTVLTGDQLGAGEKGDGGAQRANHCCRWRSPGYRSLTILHIQEHTMLMAYGVENVPRKQTNHDASEHAKNTS